MRQAGVFAAAGLVAFDTMIDRLAEDHRKASRLAEFVRRPASSWWRRSRPTWSSPGSPDLMEAGAYVAALAERGLQINPPKGGRIRFVMVHRRTSRPPTSRRRDPPPRRRAEQCPRAAVGAVKAGPAPRDEVSFMIGATRQG